MATLKIHKTAIVDPRCNLGLNVEIGPFSIVHANVSIGDDSVIGSHCDIGHPASTIDGNRELIIGKNALIRSHSIFYEGSVIGHDLKTGHNVTVRERANIGNGFQIGTLSDVQGYCTIGNFVRFHSNVHIGQQSTVKDYVWIFPYVVLTNDPHPPSNVLMGVTVENYVAIATMSVILPGVTIGEGALVGAHSSVAKDVQSNSVVAGSPAKYICDTSKIYLRDGSGDPAYPWRMHFRRGYPEDLISRWKLEFGK